MDELPVLHPFNGWAMDFFYKLEWIFANFNMSTSDAHVLFQYVAILL